MRAEDEELFDQLAKTENLSSAIAQALRAYSGKDVPEGMSEFLLHHQLKKIKFIGRQIWWSPDDQEYDYDESLSDSDRNYFESGNDEPPEQRNFQIFQTKKNKILAYWSDDLVREQHYRIYESLDEFAQAYNLTKKDRVYQWLAASIGEHVVEELDV